MGNLRSVWREAPWHIALRSSPLKSVTIDVKRDFVYNSLQTFLEANYPTEKKNREIVKSIKDTGHELPWHRAIYGMVRVTWSRDLSLIRHCSNINPCLNVDIFLGFVASRNGVLMPVFDQSHPTKCKFLSPLFSLGLQVNSDLSRL